MNRIENENTQPATMTRSEIARRLGIHRHTLTKMIERGEVKVASIGLRRRIPTSELARLLATATETVSVATGTGAKGGAL